MHGRNLLFKGNYYYKNEGRYDEYAKSHLYIHRKEVNGCRGKKRHRFDHDSYDPCRHMSYGVKVARHSGHQIARAVLFKEGHILMLYLVIELHPHPVQYLLRTVFICKAVGVDYNDSDQGKPDHQRHKGKKPAAVCLHVFPCIFARKEIVDYLPGKDRNCKLQRIIGYRAKHSDNV